VDLVRFCNSGTEANLLAQRLASAVTGRDSVLAARAGYHGSADVFMAATTGAGGPRTLLAEHGDLSTWAEVLERHGDRIAAVFVEPVLGAGGVVEAPHGFLAELAELSRQAGALFVLDEVITFRLAPGGAQSLHGVTPDLTTFGKVIGGGLPVGAIGGRRQLMERFDPNRPDALAHGGTYNGNPVTTAAGLVTVQHLTGPEITRIAALAQRLADGVVQAARAVGLPASVRVAGSIANVYLQDAPPRTALDRTDGQLMSAVHLAGLVHGLFFTSRGMLATSTALDESLVDEAVRRMTLALRDVADSVAAPPVS
jgi:glutamate-1-semialdehyde 2,1-aminomutase